MTGATAHLGTVHWDDEPERTREVVSLCARCVRVDPSFAMESIGDVMIVSPSGVAHHSPGYDMTDCGIDATGPEWWWRL